MISYTGQLNELGPSQQSGKNIKFVFIQIGEHFLKNVTMTPVLASYLQRGLETSDDITIWIKKFWLNSVAYGVSVNGRVVYNSPQIWYLEIAFCLCAAVAFLSMSLKDGNGGLSIFGVLFLFLVFQGYKQIQILNKIARQEK